MAINQEIEYKQLLTRDEYDALRNEYFNTLKPFTQKITILIHLILRWQNI